MAVKVTTGEFAPFGNCVIISNEQAELKVLTDIGPRIISYKALGGESFLYPNTQRDHFSDDAEIMQTFGKDKYYFIGGHRLWNTPETFATTYYPDEDPVEWTAADNGVVFKCAPRPDGTQYTVKVELEEAGTGVTVTQTVANTGSEPYKTAPWGITQCMPGGVAIVPQNTRQCSPLPNRMVVHWPYNDMLDSRFVTGRRYITLSQRDNCGSFKFGCNNEAGWCAYARGGQLLVKRFPFEPDAVYPDYGCNCESYTDARALEIESLGAEVTLKKDEAATLVEQWSIHTLPEGFDKLAVDSDAFADAIDSVVSGLK